MTKARSNATANAAKGDLTVGNGTNLSGVLAVGNNGETIVADSSTATGLRYQGNFAAGKNKVINGDFGIWQRGTSFSSVPYGSYYADRWLGGTDGSGITRTVSQQTFTPGTAPVSGYEGQYFLRINQSVAGTGSGYNVLDTKLEDARTFAGQTVTISFWAKAAASTTLGNLVVVQSFGSGGSGDVTTIVSAIGTITTSWTRYSFTVAIPSVSGKTIGAGSFLLLRWNLPLNAVFTFDMWGVQMEASNTATAFQTATGTLQGELAACQRYYWRGSGTQGVNAVLGLFQASSTTAGRGYITFPVTMRTAPTSVDWSSLSVNEINAGYTVSAVTLVGSGVENVNMGAIAITTTGLNQYRYYAILINNSSSGYLGFSAEL